MAGEALGIGIVVLAIIVGLGAAFVDHRVRIAREVAAGIVRSEWRMEERNTGIRMVHDRAGEVLSLADYEARIEAGPRRDALGPANSRARSELDGR